MKIILTAFLLVFVLSCLAQAPVNHWEKAFLSGKVKTVRYSAGYSRDIKELSVRPFDTNEYWVDSFTQTGRKYAAYRVINGAVTDYADFKFDAKNNSIEETWTSIEDSRLTEHRTYKYDSVANLLEEISYDTDGRPGRSVVYAYIAGRLAAKTISAEADTQTATYKYNNQGQVTEEIQTQRCGSPVIYQYAYDEKGNKVSAVLATSAYESKTIWAYDEHNNAVLEQSQNADNTIRTSHKTEYTYDRHGNWTRRLEDSGNVLVCGNSNADKAYTLTVREIEYYE